MSCAKEIWVIKQQQQAISDTKIQIVKLTIYCKTSQSRSSHPFEQGILDTQKRNRLLHQILS